MTGEFPSVYQSEVVGYVLSRGEDEVWFSDEFERWMD